jgi:glycosyltransferase involved in cell wall biosynthesis
MLGQVTQSKELSQGLQVFSRYHAAHPQTRFVIIGEAVDVDVDRLIKQLPLSSQKNVVWHGYVADFNTFQSLVATIDIVLALRFPTAGESSAAALRALAQGRPLLVYDHGWYSELPDNVAIKLPVRDEAALLAAFEEAAQRHVHMATAARQYIETVHAPHVAARQITQFLRDVLSSNQQRFA